MVVCPNIRSTGRIRPQRKQLKWKCNHVSNIFQKQLSTNKRNKSRKKEKKRTRKKSAHLKLEKKKIQHHQTYFYGIKDQCFYFEFFEPLDPKARRLEEKWHPNWRVGLETQVSIPARGTARERVPCRALKLQTQQTLGTVPKLSIRYQ